MGVFVPKSDANPPGALGRDRVEPVLRAGLVPGAALARVTDGQVDWVAGYGRCSTSLLAPHVTPDTMFQAASVSKAICALAVMELVDQGRLGLDQPVSPLLAFDIPEHPILGHQDTELPRREITARLLLQHRAGIVGRGTTPTSATSWAPPDKGGGSLRFLQRRNVDLPTLAESWMGTDRSQPVSITYPPGTRVSYSGAGYLVLQHLIEQITGETFDTHLGSLLARLGAPEATFALRPPPPVALARGHDTAGRPLPGAYELVPWSAAGGLFITARGLGEVLATMVRNCDDIISDDLMDEMYTRNMGVFGKRIGDHRSFYHGGDNSGYRASITGVVATGTGAAVLTNGRSNSGTETRVMLSSLIFDS